MEKKGVISVIILIIVGVIVVGGMITYFFVLGGGDSQGPRGYFVGGEDYAIKEDIPPYYLISSSELRDYCNLEGFGFGRDLCEYYKVNYVSEDNSYDNLVAIVRVYLEGFNKKDVRNSLIDQYREEFMEEKDWKGNFYLRFDGGGDLVNLVWISGSNAITLTLQNRKGLRFNETSLGNLFDAYFEKHPSSL